MNERTDVAWEHFSYQRLLWEIVTAVNRRALAAEIIGYELSERTGIHYPLYQLVINPEAEQTICLVAGIHGNEIAGPLAVLHLLQRSTRILPRRFRYVIYPVINPGGFDLRQRYDDDYRDLNALYKTTLESKNYREVQHFYAAVQQFAPFAAVFTLHEDSDLDKFYMYGLGAENVDFYHALCKRAHHYCALWSHANIYGHNSDGHGLILATAHDHALDAALYAQGLAPIALTLETPGRLAVEFRTRLMADLVLHGIRLLCHQAEPQVRGDC